MGVAGNGLVEGKNSKEIWYVCRVVTPEQVSQQTNQRPGEPQRYPQGKQQQDKSTTPECCSSPCHSCPCKQQCGSRPSCSVPRHHCCPHLCSCGNMNLDKLGSTLGKQTAEMDPEDLDLSHISMVSGTDEQADLTSKSLNASGMPVTQEDLTEQLGVVQDMVQDMKNGFVTVLGELSKIQYGDQTLQHQWSQHKTVYTTQISDLTETVQSLKAEMGTMSEQVKTLAENQKSLEEKLDSVQSERDILLQELQKNGKLSQECREKLNIKSSTAVTTPQSDFDSGVNLHQNEGSSGGAITPPQMSPMVKPFMESLQTAHEVNVEEHYDSDSASITAVANRSLQLSQTLRAKYAEMNTSGSSDEVEDNHNSSYEEVSPATDRGNAGGKQYNCSSASESNLHVPLQDHAYNENERQKIVEEILTSERKYCSTLWTVIDDYVSPLRQMSLMTSRDLNAMFPPYLSQMYTQHCSILRRLEDRVMNWRWNGVVGDIFAKLTDTQEHDLLTLYRDYVNDFPSALSNLNKWRGQSRKFKSFLKNHHHGRGSQGTDVTTLLLAPIQRIPRYVLLIKELLKCTDHSHPDRYYLVASLAILRNFLNQLNDEIQHAVQLVEGETSARSRSAASVKSSGSSCDARHGLSARDSGIHSTGEEIVKLHQSPPPRHIVSLRSRQPAEGKDLGNRTPMDSYKRRMRMATSQPNINRGTPTSYRAESPYSMGEVAAGTATAPRTRERLRRAHNRKTIDSFPMVQNVMPQRSNSPRFVQNSVPRLQLDDYLDDIPEPGSKSYRTGPTPQRPMSVVENRYDDYDMDRLAQLAHNRPRSAAEYMLLQEEQFQADAEAQLQRMLDMQDEYPPRVAARNIRTRNRLSLTPDEEHYGGISVRPNRDRERNLSSKLASIDHLIDPGLIGRRHQYERPSSARSDQRQLEQNGQDYGIFGDEDDIDEENSNEQQQQLNQPTSLPSDLKPGTQAGAGGKIMKSKSHGCVAMVVDNDADDEPSQEEIASSLAVSLADQHDTCIVDQNEQPVNSVIIDDAGKNLHQQVTAALNSIKEKRTNTLPRSPPSCEDIESEHCPSENCEPEPLVTSIPPSSMTSLPRPHSKLATSTPLGSPKKKQQRDKTKMSFSAALSKSVDDISKKSKKNSIRDSLKNIFHKKKASGRNAETDPSPESPCSSEVKDNSITTLPPFAHVTPSLPPVSSLPMPKRAAPRKPPRLRRTVTLMETFRDENGEPYSPV